MAKTTSRRRAGAVSRTPRRPRKGILELLDEGPVLGDGGYLVELEKRGYVQAGPFTPEVVLTNPGALEELHREFLDAGAEVLQSLTFYASKEKLGTVGYAGKVQDLNREAVRIARRAARDRALVAGNISLTWLYDPKEPKSADRVRREFDEQLTVQVAAGIDFVIGETFSYLGEALVGVEAGKATGLPTMITMCFENEPRTPEGKTPGQCAKALVDAGADVVGVNCLRNPRHMLPLAIEMRKAVDTPIACQPTAIRTPEGRPDFTSLPQFPYELEALTLSRREMAEYARQARAADIRFIGACCGTIPAHIREMARALGKVPREERAWRIDYDRPMSGYEYYKHTERPPGQGA